MIRIGLTGGLASGKSTVLKLFARETIAVIDSDRLAREIVQPYQEAWWEVYEYLGGEYFSRDMSLKRGWLKRLIFSDTYTRMAINNIFHPKIKEIILKDLSKLEDEGKARVVIVDVPLLFEVEWQGFFDKVLLVYARPEIEMERLIERDKISLSQAEKWLVTQIPIEEKRRFADFIIDNSGDLEETRRQVATFLRLFECQ